MVYLLCGVLRAALPVCELVVAGKGMQTREAEQRHGGQTNYE